MFNKIIFIILFVTNVVSATFCFRLQNRLVETRQQLDHYRVEFQAAQNRESDIAESIRQTGEILDSSITTVSGLRAQIAAIRENYEKMENRLHSIGDDCSFDDNHTNYREEKLK